MADCFYHPGRDAVGACVSCGKMVCLECRTMLNSKIYCQHCADEVFAKTTAKAAEPAIIKPSSGVSGAWWLLPIFFTWLGGLIAWLINKDKDPKKAKSMLLWGIGLTFIYGIIAAVVFGILALLGFGLNLTL